MSKFITRIELLQADEKDYETLSRELEKDSAGNKHKSVTVKPGKKRRGEFNYSGNISLSDVAKAVSRAVRKTGRNFSFTIIKNKPGYELDPR